MTPIYLPPRWHHRRRRLGPSLLCRSRNLERVAATRCFSISRHASGSTHHGTVNALDDDNAGDIIVPGIEGRGDEDHDRLMDGDNDDIMEDGQGG